MLTAKVNSLNSIISEDIAKILSYFNNLNKKSTGPEMLAQRILAELPVRLDALCHTLGKTTLSYLDSDARASISQWQVINKNHFYEAELAGKIANAISASDFSLQSYVVLRRSIISAIIAVSGVSLSVAPIPTVILSAVAIPSAAIKILLFGAAAGASYVVAPKITSNQEKANILKQLEDYLNDIQLELNKQINVIKEAYSKEFNTLASELGEK